MPKARVDLRIGVVQLSPKIGQVQANLARARQLCKTIKPKSLDILCFPEMAFTGYVFENSNAILPHLEKPRTGPTSQFCSELAKKLKCYVLAGYPEQLNHDDWAEIERSMDGSRPLVERVETHQVGANSAVLYDADGNWVGGYRKTNLYETDLTWARAGSGFATFSLPSPLGTMSLGICMDLNPQIQNWTSSGPPYEIADYCIEKKTNLLILLNAWLDSEHEPEEAKDWSNLSYWAARTKPLWTDGNDRAFDDPESEEDQGNDHDSNDNGDETIVVICNRTGTENGITFAGSSAIYSMRQGSGHPKLLDALERKEEALRIWNIQI